MDYSNKDKGSGVSNIDNREFTRLNHVNCGEVIHLQIITPTKPIRLKTRLIGVDPNMSVILAFGSDGSWERAVGHIKESNDVIVRFMHHEQQQALVVAFRSSIQKIMNVTGRWLVLDYPKAIESAELRQHLRVPVKLEGSLLNPDDQSIIIEGVLSDISIQGCAFVTEKDAQLTIDAIYTLNIEVGGDSQKIELSVALKNTQNLSPGQIQYGLIFMTPADEAKKSVQQLLIHHLQK